MPVEFYDNTFLEIVTIVFSLFGIITLLMSVVLFDTVRSSLIVITVALMTLSIGVVSAKTLYDNADRVYAEVAKSVTDHYGVPVDMETIKDYRDSLSGEDAVDRYTFTAPEVDEADELTEYSLEEKDGVLYLLERTATGYAKVPSVD